MTDQEIENHTQRLRDGAVLDSVSVEAIALGISRKLDEIAKLWGRKFSICSWVDLHTSKPAQLHFCERKKFDEASGLQKPYWTFIILYPMSGIPGQKGERKISEVNLEVRTAAVHALSILEKSLVEANYADRDSMLETLDLATAHIETAQTRHSDAK